MHRFSNRSQLTRFRFAALFFLLRFLVPSAGAVLLAMAVFGGREEMMRPAIGFLIATPVVIVIQWIVASRVRCPLCLAPPLMHKGCSKNRKARTLFGSYRMWVVMTGLFRGYFRCQYCGEPSELKVRERRRNGTY